MIPARDRKLRLIVYNSQSDMEADQNGTTIESGIYDGSARLEHTFFTELPGWGEANAAMFACELSDAPDLTGKYVRAQIDAYATQAATTRTTYGEFAGKVNSCKYDKYKASRVLEAYDRLYELRQVDISEWWNTWVQTQTASVIAISAIVNAMCTQYGVTNNTSMPAYSTGAAPLKARKLGACSFTQMLGYIGEICGGYFSMQDGTLRFVDMRNVNGATVQENADGNLDTQMTEISDADTEPYAQVVIYEGNDVVYSNGSGKALTIADNPLLVGQTNTTINNWGAVIYTNATRIAGRPATLALIYSQPQPGWSRLTASAPFILTTTDGGATRRHIVSGYSMSGPGLINETISCTGEMRQGASYSAAQNAMLSELTNLGTQLTFKVNADSVIEAVNLEAQGGVQINAEALNINGVQSTGGKLKVDVNGDVEVNGKITSQEGTIGGWTINETNLASSNNAVVLNSAGEIDVTETGSSATDAKIVATTSTNKAYYSAWGARIETPPNTNTGTKTMVNTEGIVTETLGSGTIHGASLTDSAGNPEMLLIDQDASDDWRNTQTEKSIAITHKDKTVTPNVTDKTMSLDSSGLYQQNIENNVRYEALVTPRNASSGSTIDSARMSLFADNTTGKTSSLVKATATDAADSAIEAKSQKIESNNVVWSTDAKLDSTHTTARMDLTSHQGASISARANNNNGNAGASGYESAAIYIDTSTDAVTNRNGGSSISLSTTRANNANSASLMLWNKINGTAHTSRMTPQTLSIDGHDLLRLTPHFAQMFATEIPANANLNTTTYLKCGQYYCTSTSGFTNSPTGKQFVMEVTAMIYNRYDDESGTADAYRIRKITDYVGNQFIQYCTKPTNGSWSYGAWSLIITSGSFPTVSAGGNITSSTTLAYTGKAITIPSDGYWAVSGYAQYGYSQPQEIGIAGVSGNYLQQYAYAARATFPSNTATLATSYTGYFTANMEVRLYARHARADSNYVAIQAKKLP